MSARRPLPGRGDAGFVLVAVLWMLALLAGLATIYSAYARASAASSTLPIQRLRAEASIRSAVELAAYQLVSQPQDKRPSHGSFEFPLGAARVAVSFLPETSRIDLNTAPDELLSAMFQELGLKPATAAAAATRVIAWRKPAPQNAAPEADDPAYRDAGLAYGPRHAPFQDPLELALIPGLSPAVVERALPHVTVFSGGAVDPAVADGFVRAALEASGQPAPAAPAQGAVAASTPSAYRVSIVVATPGRRSIHGSVVFSLQDQGDEPYQILYWRDDFDAPLGAA